MMKDESTKGYPQQDYAQPIKRYVQTMDLKDDPALIAEYRRRHSERESWPEIREGIRAVGIRHTRYALPCGLFADLASMITAIIVASLFFG